MISILWCLFVLVFCCISLLCEDLAMMMLLFYELDSLQCGVIFYAIVPSRHMCLYDLLRGCALEHRF